MLKTKDGYAKVIGTSYQGSSDYLLLSNGDSKAISSLSVNYASSAGNVDWGNIAGKPSSFTPSAHNHDGRYLRLSGDDTMTGQIKSNYSAGTWINGCTHAIVVATYKGYNSLIAAPIKSGNVCISAWNAEDNLNFGYAKTGKTDNNFDKRMYWDAPNNNLHADYFTGHLLGTADNADKLDGIHANGLLTALSNSNNGISITIGGTTKSINNISVNYANSAGNANTLDGIDSTKFLRQVVVPNNTENDFNTFSNMTLTGRVDPTTGASLKNAPWSGSGPSGGYGVLTYLFSGYSYGTQMAWEYGSNRIYIRNRYWGGSGVGSVWRTSWDTLALTSDIPSSLKNPYSLNVFGVTYDGSAVKVVSPSNFISQVNEATSTVTDGTMLITSYASNSGFADTNAINVPYKRKAIHLWEYIKAKTDSLYTTKGHNHDDRYLKLTGGIMTGTINRRSGGTTISGRDHAIIRQTYAPGGSSWNPIACVDTETGTWTLGHLSSGDSDTNFHFCFSTNADYNAGNNNGNYVTLRNKVGTIALLSEIPDKNSWNYDDRYLKLTGGTMTGTIRFNNLINIDSAIVLDYKYSAGGFARDIVSMKNSVYGDANLGALSILCYPNSTSNGFQYIYLGTDKYDGPNNLRIYKDKVTFGDNILIDAGNIGSQSVAYASKAGNADTVDGYHANAFAVASHTHPYLPLSGAYITGTNIADMKVNIRNYFNGKPAGTNCYVGSPNIIYNFQNDSAACDANSVCGIMALNPGYDNYNHGHFLVSHYGDNRIGMIGLGYSTWYGPNWFAYTSDIPTVTNYYWANIKVSASSSTSTSPTFGSLWINNSHFFKQSGTTFTCQGGTTFTLPSSSLNTNTALLWTTASDGTKDTGIFYNSSDFAFIANSNDHGAVFAVYDTDVTQDFEAGAREISVPGNGGALWARGGFSKSGSSNAYVLLGGGGHKPLSEFSTNTANVADTIKIWEHESNDAWYYVTWTTQNGTGYGSIYESTASLQYNPSQKTLWTGGGLWASQYVKAASIRLENTNEINSYSGDLYLNHRNTASGSEGHTANIKMCGTGGSVIIGANDVPSYQLDVRGSVIASSWLRTRGNSGWYSESYGGGIYMTDTSWIRTYGGKPFYCDNQIYSSYSIKMGNILLEHTDEINNSANGGLHLNYRNTGNVTLCNGGGAVTIGTTSTDIGGNKLYVNGSEFINGASNVKDHVFANGFRHRSHTSNDSVLLAGGGYSQGVPVRYWAIYSMYIGNSSTDVTYTKRSGNYNFITSEAWESEGAARFDISFPSGYNKNNTLIFGNGYHRTSSSWKTPVYVTITTSTAFGGASQIRVMISDDASLNVGFANIYFMCMG